MKSMRNGECGMRNRCRRMVHSAFQIPHSALSAKSGWTVALSMCIVTVFGGGPRVPRSTLSGVYTAAQAAQGQALYAMRCRSCHTPAGHVSMFQERWAGHPLSEPFQYISENMPKDSPGSLSPEETTAALAYFLQLMGMPPGSDSLSADTAVLDSIRIDTVTTRRNQ